MVNPIESNSQFELSHVAVTSAPDALKKGFHVPLMAIYIIYFCHLYGGDIKADTLTMFGLAIYEVQLL